ncbi:MAG: hypothetical protein RPU12_09160 [Candidatus Sedimenticola sp. (ex Thyasira tokunagai)]
MDEIKIHQAIKLLKAIIPHIDEMISYIEDCGGWLPLKEELIENIINHQLDQWATFYQDEKRLKALSALMFFDENELIDIDDPCQLRSNLHQDLLEYLESDESFSMPTQEEQKAIAKGLQSADEEELQAFSKEVCIFIWGSLASLFNYLSLMVHGRSMCQLVTAAISGDDEAFYKAVQIDRTILTLPYFRSRLLKAQLGNDPSFLSALSYRLRNPIIRGKIRYRTLWIAFAILDDEGLLKLPHERLMDICQEIGVYGKQFGIEDVGHLSKRLSEYRRVQAN